MTTPWTGDPLCFAEPMQIATSPRGSFSGRSFSRGRRSLGRRTSRLAALTLAAVSTGAVLTGCGGTDEPSADTADTAQPSSPEQPESDERVLWLGDSIAGVEAPALRAALRASGAEFQDASSDGGGTVVEGDEDDLNTEIARSTWEDLEEDIVSFRPNVIAYQITTYDWGTPEQQSASYERLAQTARDAGAELVIVSAPPFKRDDFYRPYASAIDSAPQVAERVADAGGDQVHFFDAEQLWGADHGAAKAQRSSDGIHSCQQGSAAFADWFTDRLAEQLGFTPAEPEQWANDSWVEDEAFALLDCG